MKVVTEEGSRSSTALRVRPAGIHFHNVAHDRVAIAIDVENPSGAPSEPTTMRIEAAPFGAFVAWSPLTTLDVPSVPPRGTVTLRTVVAQARPAPAGSFEGFVPPDPRVVADGSGDAPRRWGPAFALAGQLFKVLRRVYGTGASRLPPDVHDLLGEARPHWAGNLDVWIGEQPVERHVARLRIEPAHANLAMFCVGDRADGYAFAVHADDDWAVGLFDARFERLEVREAWKPDSAWHRMEPCTLCLLVVRPPEHARAGRVEVHVTRRSSGATAVVEFDLDPSAPGPGCYTA